MQNEFIVHNLHLKKEFCEIWQKSAVVIPVKNHQKYRKPDFFDKKQKLTTNFWHLPKCEFFLYMFDKIAFKVEIYLVNELLNCSCAY